MRLLLFWKVFIFMADEYLMIALLIEVCLCVEDIAQLNTYIITTD